MEENTEITENSTETAGRNGEHLRPYQWKKGQSGNPGGRPKGSLKDYVKRKLAEMSEEDKEQFLREIPKDLQWRMSEGNPSSDDKLAAEIKIIVSNESLENATNPGTIDDSEGQA